MALVFKEVKNDKDLKELYHIVQEIWTEYWPAIIGAKQTNYMIEMFHSPAAMKRDIAEHNYRYWFIYDTSGQLVGYTAASLEIMTGNPEHDCTIEHNPVVQERWNRRWFISKIYLYREARGKHYASRIIDFHEELARSLNLQVMYLTVNIHNELGIRAYRGNGFEIVDTRPSDIGEGYVMDDHIMAKELV